MKNRNIKNYSSELLLTQDLVENIKDYYKARKVPTWNMRFIIDKSLDDFGTTLYTIRSNLVFNVKDQSLRLSEKSK